MSVQAEIRGLATGINGQRAGNRNYMTESNSDPQLSENMNLHTNSNGSIATMVGPPLPPGVKVVPVNFGIKFSPPKLGLQYHLPNEPHHRLVYEVNLQNFIKKQMKSDAVTNYLFDVHQDYINPKVIARSQVYRLVDKVMAKVAPHLALGDQGMTMNTQSATSLNS